MEFIVIDGGRLSRVNAISARRAALLYAERNLPRERRSMQVSVKVLPVHMATRIECQVIRRGDESIETIAQEVA